MIDYIQSWCLRAVDRVRGRAVEHEIKYQDVPVEARVTNPLSKKAVFNYYTKRRKGYSVTVNAKEFLSLVSTADLTEERRAILLDNWFRGIIWQPIMVVANTSKGVWTVDTITAIDVVVFMAERDEIIKLQIVEKEDVPATEEKLHLLKEGLFDGWKVRCPVLTSQLVL